MTFWPTFGSFVLVIVGYALLVESAFVEPPWTIVLTVASLAGFALGVLGLSYIIARRMM